MTVRGMFRGMRKKGKRRLLATVCTMAAVCAVPACVLAVCGRTGESAVVSGGLQRLADARYLACSAVAGTDIVFDAAWFDEAVGGAVSAITVTALPPAAEGSLRLGYGAVTAGQSIARETLSYLTFTPADGVKSSSFSFVPTTAEGTVPYALTCALRVTESVNCCPVGNKSVMAVSTHETLRLTGALVAEDPEGDALYYEVCTYPVNGTVTVHALTGGFVYIPAEGFAGKDTFTWRAQDENGAYSAPSTVEVTVRELGSACTFADMAGDANHTFALRVSEAGLMSGEKMGGKHYFHPERVLTRAAFVAILLEAAEIKVPDVAHTAFADDADIPAPMRGAVQYAREKGYIEAGEKFRPNDAVTRAEAAAIASKVLGLSAPGYHETVTDFAAIPVAVADALYAIYEGGYIATMEGGALVPAGELTRGDAARFFACVLDARGK